MWVASSHSLNVNIDDIALLVLFCYTSLVLTCILHQRSGITLDTINNCRVGGDEFLAWLHV